jgi:succinate-semialdehyde dehydrogenase/glutarate-semialdehyde dehydrogenase
VALESVNPATGERVARHEEHDAAAIEARLVLASRAAPRWGATPLDERTAVLTRAADLLDARRDRYARLITDEMGKPIGEARAEVAKCATGCRYYARHAAGMLAPEAAHLGTGRGYVTFDPLGPLLAVMPWNFPFWQVFRFAAPALAAGNVALLKHASNVCGAALAIEETWRDAGCPPGVFQTLLVGAARVAALIGDERVRGVSLTGSEGAGARVAELAGRALKKCVLELGGSDPFLVLADADVPAAARRAAAARTVNSGQSCIAAKRFLVVADVAAAFTDALAGAMAALVVGDPRDERTQVGPLARADLRVEVARQVEASVGAGARLVGGGRALPGPGFFYAPTVLADVRSGMPAFDDEVFGPVAAVTVARDERDAVALANRSRFGLGASIWTRDVARAEMLARQIDAGLVFINDLVRSDPALPFGGVKHSGYGRELSHFGLREFVNVRSIVIGTDDDSRETAASIE